MTNVCPPGQVNEDGNDQFRVVGVLSRNTVIVFQLRGVKLLEKPVVHKALMILAEQVEHIGRRQEPWIKLDGIRLECGLHDITQVFFQRQYYSDQLNNKLFRTAVRRNEVRVVHSALTCVQFPRNRRA